MPQAVYDKVVRPCWNVNVEAADQAKVAKSTQSCNVRTSAMYADRPTFAEIDEALSVVVNDEGIQEEEELFAAPLQPQRESHDGQCEYITPSQQRVARSLYALTTLEEAITDPKSQPPSRKAESAELGDSGRETDLQEGDYVLAQDQQSSNGLYAVTNSGCGQRQSSVISLAENPIAGGCVLPKDATRSTDLYALRNPTNVKTRHSIKQVSIGNKYATLKRVDISSRSQDDIHEVLVDAHASDLRLTDLTNKGFTLYVSPRPVKVQGKPQDLPKIAPQHVQPYYKSSLV